MKKKVYLSLMFKEKGDNVRIMDQEMKLPMAPFPGMGIQFKRYTMIVDYVKYIPHLKGLAATVKLKKQYRPVTLKMLNKDGWIQTA